MNEMFIYIWFHSLTIIGIILALYKRSITLVFLLFSAFMQFQMRDILFQNGINLNSAFGIEVNGEIYNNSLLIISIFNTSLLIFISLLWSREESLEIKRTSLSTSEYFLYFIFLWIGFFYFGGQSFDGAQTRAAGSSLIVLIGTILICGAVATKQNGIKFHIFAFSAIFVTTQKLLVFVYLSRFISLKNKFSLFGITILGMVLILLSAFLRGEILSGVDIVFNLARSLFGHYESVLPVYKYLETKSDFVTVEQFIVSIFDVWGLYVNREDTIYYRFNEVFFENWGVLIVPTLMLVYTDIFGYFGLILSGFAVVINLQIIRTLFGLVVDKVLAVPFTLAFALLVIEASPDGLTFFYRMLMILAMIKLIKIVASRGAHVRKLQ